MFEKKGFRGCLYPWPACGTEALPMPRCFADVAAMRGVFSDGASPGRAYTHILTVRQVGTALRLPQEIVCGGLHFRVIGVRAGGDCRAQLTIYAHRCGRLGVVHALYGARRRAGRISVFAGKIKK